MISSQRAKELLPSFLFCFFAIIWFFFSINGWITDSEFWPITVSRELFQLQGHYQPVLFYKPIFHLTLAGLHFLPLDNVQHIVAAKILFAFFGLGTLYFVYKVGRQILTAWNALFYVLIILFTPVVFFHLGNIRSDNLATFWAAVGVCLWPAVLHRKFGLQLLYWSALWTVLLLTTPKSFFIAVLIYASYYFVAEKSVYWRLSRYLGSFAVLILGFICSLHLLMINSHPWMSFVAALQHGYRSFKLSGLGFANFDVRTYLLLSLPVIIFGAFFHLKELFSWWIKKQHIQPLRKSYLVMGTSVLILFFVFEPKQTFFIASLFPLWALSWMPALSQISHKKMVFIVSGLFLVTVFMSRHFYFVSNSNQLSALSDLDRYLGKDFQGTLVDGIGLLPRASKDLIYLGPQDEGNEEQVIQYITIQRPEFILNTPRVLHLHPRVQSILNENYELCEKGLLGKNGHCHQEKRNWQWAPWEIFKYRGSASE